MQPKGIPRYPVHAHRGSETESKGSDLAPVSDVEMDVDENDQDENKK